jgi:hypothetical protein
MTRRRSRSNPRCRAGLRGVPPWPSVERSGVSRIPFTGTRGITGRDVSAQTTMLQTDAPINEASSTVR